MSVPQIQRVHRSCYACGRRVLVLKLRRWRRQLFSQQRRKGGPR
jgi:hypothetical protein